MMTELRERADVAATNSEKCSAGALPRAVPANVWAGYGTGRAWDGCQAVIPGRGKCLEAWRDCVSVSASCR